MGSFENRSFQSDILDDYLLVWIISVAVPVYGLGVTEDLGLSRVTPGSDALQFLLQIVLGGTAADVLGLFEVGRQAVVGCEEVVSLLHFLPAAKTLACREEFI